MRRNVIIILGSVFLFFIVLFAFLVPKGRSKKRVSFKALVAQADAALSKGDLIKARTAYENALNAAQNPTTLEKIKNKIEDLNIKILFSPLIDNCSVEYIVKPKDTLINIAHKFQTTVSLIKRANRLKNDIIHPKQKLKVNTCKFSIAVDKSQNILFLKRNDTVIKTYLVSTGKNNCTPVGRFKVANKLKNPVWFKAGAVVPPNSPDNVLGTRWIGLNIKGYGIHGNRDENEIGKQVTQGCIRMKNKDVEELYDIVPVGTEVIIVN